MLNKTNSVKSQLVLYADDSNLIEPSKIYKNLEVTD